jgi:uncharacterized protein
MIVTSGKTQQNQVKQIVLDTLSKLDVKVLKILLFGSRARNDFQEDSDWDLLIILKNQATRDEKNDISYQIRRALAKLLISSDVIVRSQSEINKYTRRVNSVTKTAIEEGIPL